MRFLLCQLRGPKRNDTPITISVPSTQILVSNIILQEKEPVLLKEMADSRAEAGNIQKELRASYSAKSREVLKTKTHQQY